MSLLAARDWTLTALGITVINMGGLKLAVRIVLSGAGAGRCWEGSSGGGTRRQVIFSGSARMGGGGAVAEAGRAPVAGREDPR